MIVLTLSGGLIVIIGMYVKDINIWVVIRALCFSCIRIKLIEQNIENIYHHPSNSKYENVAVSRLDICLARRQSLNSNTAVPSVGLCSCQFLP